MRSRTRFAFLVSLLFGSLGSTRIQADTISESVPIAGQSIVTNAAGNVNFTQNIPISFNKFDPALGTLTQIDIAYTYNFQLTLQLGPTGGGGGGSASGPFIINGLNNPPLTGGGNGTGGGGGPGQTLMLPFTAAGLYTTTEAANFTTFLAATPGELGNLTFEAQINITPDPGVLTSSMDLFPSSLNLTYTFTPAPVPEPTLTFGLASFAALGIVLRRRLG